MLHRFAPAALLLLAAALPVLAEDAPKTAEKPAEPAAPAASGKLEAGAPAPALEVSGWLQGEEVKSFEKGTVYVVECWASWCGPCRMMFPHLSELHAQYTKAGKKVVIIGVDVWERDAKAGPETFEKMKEQMTYRVAVDGGQVAKNWLKAAGQNGIPTAFVVDGEGKIAWIGHPMELEEVVDAVLEGGFDPAAHAKAKQEVGAAMKKGYASLRGKDAAAAAEAVKAIDAVIAAHPKAVKDMRSLRHCCQASAGDIAAMRKEVEAELGTGAYGDLMTAGSLADHLLKNLPADNRQLDLIEKVVDQAAAKDKGKSQLLQLTTAELRTAQGRKDDARKIYDAVIAAPDSPFFKKAAEEAKAKLDA